MTMSLVRVGHATALAAAATWFGCGSAGVFVCQADSDCRAGGPTGTCQPTGYCSFPDDACESGQRYGDHASESLSETCVDVDEPAPTATMSPSCDGSTTGVPPSPTVATTSPDDGTTTSPVDDTGPPESGPSSEDDDTGDPSTTTGSPSQCWIDEFDDGAIDPAWCAVGGPAIVASEHDGLLWFDLQPEQWRSGNEFGEVRSCDPFPVLDAVFTVEVDHVLHDSPFTQSFIELGTDDGRLGLGVLDGVLEVLAFQAGGYVSFPVDPYDEQAHRHWRVLGTIEGLTAAYSGDGEDWVEVYTLPQQTAGAEAIVRVGAWGSDVPLGPDHASYERVELCTSSAP